jgi:hypothetical protein
MSKMHLGLIVVEFKSKISFKNTRYSASILFGQANGEHFQHLL